MARSEGTAGPAGPAQSAGPAASGEGVRGAGRRAVLGAALLGASAAALGTGGAAVAAEGDAARGRGLAGLPKPAVIAHRGASGHRPEHTLGAYQLALDMGADIIEAGDLVITKDGHLVCRHEPEIGGTTDVAAHPEFAGRRTTKSLDGVPTTGWFAEDFTLAELKTLRAKERVPANRPHNTLYDGVWEIPTFEEVLRWQDEQARRRGRPVFVYPELKHPSYFRERGLPLEERLAKVLRRHGKHRRTSPVLLQSFEPTSIRRMRELVDNPLAVLLSSAGTRPWDLQQQGDPRTVSDLITPQGLAWIASFADGIGPTLDLIVPRDVAGNLTSPTSLVADAHKAGLILHPYTMRNENPFLPANFRRGAEPDAYGDAFAAFSAYFDTGIDGVFTDQPDTGLLARELWRAAR
ncbi:glycerophosphodiester phosphodiesterase [Streptomyces sp. NPDC056600]|uniref:glycerophosphodiester phosphodiesterase n=1 Tax=Streptomyces sp. NPDC056600 TaxID=3345874 RepID=UPI0036BC9FBB